MALERKVLGQETTAAGVWKMLYQVPAGAHTVISTLTCATLSAVASNLSIQIRVAGAAEDPKQYEQKCFLLGGHDSIEFRRGWTLGPLDEIWVLDSTGTMSWACYGEVET